MNTVSPQTSKYRISRRGRKLLVSDDSRTLIALPKDVPERTWAEILQKEENDLIVFDIREEILDEALRIGYEHYMARQNAPFTVHCAALAWLKLIDWFFYRHDPGEEASAYPPCYIPHRADSWLPDRPPEPSPRDSWCKQELTVVEDTLDELPRNWASTASLHYPIIEPIPQEYWFPGKVKLKGVGFNRSARDRLDDDSYVRRKPLVVLTDKSGVWNYVQEEESSSADLAADSEQLQKVTDYSTGELSKKESQYSALKTTTPVPVEASLQGAGDSPLVRPKKKLYDKSKLFSKASVAGRSRGAILPPLDSRSKVSLISDCRLRNLRLDTHYEISSEKVESTAQTIKKK